MKKFILLTFGFLGWAFYEMSGGADFVPASARVAPIEETVLAVVPAEAPAQPADTEELPEVDPQETAELVDTTPDLDPLPAEVTRVALNLTTLQEVLDDTAAAASEPVATAVSDSEVPVNPGFSVSSANTPAIIPSLVAGVDTQSQPAVAIAAVTNDIRTVSGNRVNVRGGPGTDFGIVSRLVRGDAVEVLEDNGTGWVRMRPVDSDVEGWMADFLLTSG